jgi:hypothetical protein
MITKCIVVVVLYSVQTVHAFKGFFCLPIIKIFNIYLAGRCGICGEDANGPKRFEKGGALYTGISVRNYTRGQVIDVKVYLSANHLGWTEFRICNVDKLQTDATQECLDQTLLKDLDGNSRIPIVANVYNFHTQLQLPHNLACNHCVFQVGTFNGFFGGSLSFILSFQWKYHAGNSWNKDQETGTACLGCGPQEEFYGCADISIFKGSFVQTKPTLTHQTTTTTTTTTTTSAYYVPLEKSTAFASTVSVEMKKTYKYSKKVVFNPIANRIEIILYKKDPNAATKKFEIIPKVREMFRPTKAVSKKSKDELCENGDGHYADLNTNCKEYYVCVFSGTPLVKVIRLRCPNGN